MKRGYLIIILLILLSSGCREKSPNLVPKAIQYHTGTTGLEIKTIDGLPPEEIIESNDFVIGLELKNTGAYDIEGARISISGFEKGYIAIDQPEVYIDIEGKKPGFPEGSFEIINFKAKDIAIPEIIETYTAPYRISASYRYQTQAAAEVCINPEIYSYIKTKDKICEPGEITLSGGQGAPVAVTKIDQAFAPFGDKIKANFIIHFTNKGDGKLEEGVYVDEVRLSNAPISCIIPEEPILLKDNEERSILCSAKILPSAGTYLAPIAIKLIYDYTTQIDQTIKIKTLLIRNQ